MKLNSRTIFYFIKDIFLKLITILLPIILVFVGILLINYEILQYFLKTLGIFETEVNYLKIIFGGISLIFAVLSVWLTVKFKSIYYFATLSLILNGIFIFIMLLFLITPALDFLVGSILFRKGFCTVLDRAVALNTNSNQETLEAKNQFCTIAGKMFNFDYPTKYSN